MGCSEKGAEPAVSVCEACAESGWRKRAALAVAVGGTSAEGLLRPLATEGEAPIDKQVGMPHLREIQPVGSRAREPHGMGACVVWRSAGGRTGL